MVAHVIDVESENTSVGYGVVVGLLQSYKQKGAVEAASAIAAYSHNGESKIKSEVLSATLEDWAMAIHHTWIDSIDKHVFIEALHGVNKFNQTQILNLVSRYFLEFKLTLHVKGLPEYSLLETSSEEDNALILHAFSNPIREEYLSDALEPIKSSDYISIDVFEGGDPSIKTSSLDVFENQCILFECIGDDGRGISIKQVMLEVFTVKGQAQKSILTQPAVSAGGDRFECHALKSVQGCAFVLRVDFCIGSDSKIYSLSLEE